MMHGLVVKTVELSRASYRKMKENLGHRLQRGGPAAGCWCPGAFWHLAVAGSGRVDHVCQHGDCGPQCPVAAPG